MNRKGKVIKNSKKSYGTCKWSIGERNLLSGIALALLARGGWTQQSVNELFREASCEVPASTLSKWLRNIGTTLQAVPRGSGGGHRRLLDVADQDILAGFILDCNSSDVEVHLNTIVEFLQVHLHISMTEPAAYQYITALGFSSHKLKHRKKSYVREADQLVEKYYEWLLRHRIVAASFLVCSIDCTFTSHRRIEPHGYARTGIDAPDISDRLPIYTNCIVTCVWADGVNRTPAVLFTYNPLFRRDRKSTPRRADAEKHLMGVLAEFHVDERRVIYAGAVKGETRKYCAESHDLIKRFLDIYPDLPKNIQIFSDVGNCFFENGEDVFLQRGFENHAIYEPIFHHFISPNDNNLHGTAKQLWRKMFKNFSDDVRCSVALLACLDKANVHVAGYFAESFQYGSHYGYQVDKEKIKRVCHAELVNADEKLLAGYRIWAGIDGRGFTGDTTSQLYSALDGDYWQ